MTTYPKGARLRKNVRQTGRTDVCRLESKSQQSRIKLLMGEGGTGDSKTNQKQRIYLKVVTDCLNKEFNYCWSRLVYHLTASHDLKCSSKHFNGCSRWIKVLMNTWEEVTITWSGTNRVQSLYMKSISITNNMDKQNPADHIQGVSEPELCQKIKTSAQTENENAAMNISMSKEHRISQHSFRELAADFQSQRSLRTVAFTRQTGPGVISAAICLSVRLNRNRPPTHTGGKQDDTSSDD